MIELDVLDLVEELELELVELEELLELEELEELEVDAIELEVVVLEVAVLEVAVLEETMLLEDVEVAELSELLGASETVVPLLHAVSVSKMDEDRIVLKIFFFIFCPFCIILGTNIPNTIIYIHIYNVKLFFGFGLNSSTKNTKCIIMKIVSTDNLSTLYKNAIHKKICFPLPARLTAGFYKMAL